MLGIGEVADSKPRRYYVDLRLTRSDGTRFRRQKRGPLQLDQAKLFRDKFYEEFVVEELGFAERQSEGPKLSECFAEWYERAKRFRPHDCDDIKQKFEDWVKPRLGEIRVAELSAVHVSDHFFWLQTGATYRRRLGTKNGKPVYVDRSLSWSLILTIKGALSLVLDFAVERGYCAQNLTRTVKVKRVVDRSDRLYLDGEAADSADGFEKVLSREQVAELLRVTKEHVPSIYGMVLMQARLGLRISEARALRVSDFDLKNGTIRIIRQHGSTKVYDPIEDRPKSVVGDRALKARKKGDGRVIYLPPSVIDYVASLPPDQKLIVPNDAGNPIDESKAHELFKQAVQSCKAVPKETTSHWLRHSWISHALNHAKASIVDVMAMSGHKSMQVLARYAHSDNETMRDAMSRMP